MGSKMSTESIKLYRQVAVEPKQVIMPIERANSLHGLQNRGFSKGKIRQKSARHAQYVVSL